MPYSGYEEFSGAPFAGRALEELCAFLESMGLRYDDGIGYSVALRAEDGKIAATGSLDGNVIKCVAAAHDIQGEGLCTQVISHLAARAAREGQAHLFLFTKPENRKLFSGLGFYPICDTADALLLENRRDGVKNFVAGLRRPTAGGRVGAIVANCNPFTKGHLYLVEQAARECELLYLFILSEDRSAFPAQVRLRLAQEGTAHLPNVAVSPTNGYLVSAATFPDYFLKEKARAEDAACDMDVAVFCGCFAGPLGIEVRFVGEEPFCPVTRAYNAKLKAGLPPCGVEVREIPRCRAAGVDGEAVSATRVRALLAEGRLEALPALVPETTLRFLRSEEGGKIVTDWAK